MILSKFAVFINIKEKIWYVYNNLLFEPVCLNDNEVNAIKQYQFEKFSSDEITILKEKGIIVENSAKDCQVLELVKSYTQSGVDEGISLIYIIPCNTCNLACKYCFIGSLNDEKTIIMSDDTIVNIVNKISIYLKEKGKSKVDIVFYGAEPFMAFETLKKIVNKLNSLNNISFNYSIVTNGTLISDDVLNWLSDNHISIGISIDGPRDINDINRVFKNETKSVYDNLIKKIDMLKNKGIDFCLSITLTHEVLEDLNYLDWIKKLDVKSINFNLLHYTEPNNQWKEYYFKASEFLFIAYDYLAPLGIVDDRLQRKIRAFNSSFFKYNDCGAVGGNQICIAPDGDITVCHGYWNSNKERCGNINENEISEITEHSNFIKWKKNLTINKEECLLCPAIYICGGGCAMQSGTIFNSQYNLDKGFCLHTLHSLNELFLRTLEK